MSEENEYHGKPVKTYTDKSFNPHSPDCKLNESIDIGGCAPPVVANCTTDKMKDEFNRYCADVMGMRTRQESLGRVWVGQHGLREDILYNPYDNLNQMIEVVDKLMIMNNRNCLVFVEAGVKKTFHDFIISTMPN